MFNYDRRGRGDSGDTQPYPAISKLAAWEPPYHVDPDAPELPYDFAAQLDNLVKQGRRAMAVELFMVKAAEVPAEAVAAMRTQPSWSGAEAVAHTLAYEAAVMGPGNELPAEVLTGIAQPTLVLTGENSPAWMTSAGKAVSEAVPAGSHRVLKAQAHNVAPRPSSRSYWNSSPSPEPLHHGVIYPECVPLRARRRTSESSDPMPDRRKGRGSGRSSQSVRSIAM